MTDIAGLCERLEAMREWHDRTRDRETITLSKATLERQDADIERLRKAAKAFESAVTTDIPVGPGYAEWIAKAQKARADLQAALTGEDTAGSPTSQNTQPGLAFSDAGKL
jgi:hypothetical protein